MLPDGTTFKVPADHNAVDNSKIVDFCKTAKPDDTLYNLRNQIVRFEDLVIKFGKIPREEAENQNHAYTLLDPHIVLVPKVYCYFNNADVDYLVMEYAAGEQRSKIEDNSTVEAIARIVAHLHQFTGDKPGSVGNGKCVGTLWPEDEDIFTESREHLKLLVQSRCLACQFVLDNAAPLVFIHGDIRLSNILFSPRGIWLIDWEFAGYFPRTAEHAILRQDYGPTLDDLEFRDRLEHEMVRQKPLTHDDLLQIDAWLEYAFNNISYSWAPRVGQGKKKKRKKKDTVSENEESKERGVGIESSGP